MSGLFERIARRRATPPDETQELAAPEPLGIASPGAEPTPFATSPRDAAVAGPGSDGEATAQQPAVPADPAASGASFRERGRVRRRLRYLRRLRELQLRDLGGLVFELRRFGRHREDLVAAKVTQLATTDEELRHLEEVLRARRAFTELREPGIGGACPACGALHGSADHYCSNCGRPLGSSANGHEPAARQPELQPAPEAEPATEPEPQLEPAAEPQEPHGVA